MWQPPVALSPAAQAIVPRIRRAKLLACLRRSRHERCSEAFHVELAPLFRDSPTGQPPALLAHLALVTLLQACTGAADDAAIEALTMDRRWQLVRAWLDGDTPPVCQAPLGRL
jgi:transposase